MTRALCKGDARVFKALEDRAYGKIKETVELDASNAVVERLLAGRQRAALKSLGHEELQEQRLQLRRAHRGSSPRPGTKPDLPTYLKETISRHSIGAWVSCWWWFSEGRI